jgi:hypothetical protein
MQVVPLQPPPLLLPPPPPALLQASAVMQVPVAAHIVWPVGQALHCAVVGHASLFRTGDSREELGEH